MFGLEKLKFKTKVILVSVIIIIVSMGIVYIRNTTPITVIKINDWVFITSNDEGSWYYKSNLINIDNQTHIIEVLVKNIYTDIGKQKFLETHKNGKYTDINRSLSMVSINYQKMTYQQNRVVYYSKSNNIIGNDELAVKIDDLIPQSVGNKLIRKILEDYNIVR
ncbi:MAG: hypothetical protein M0P73_05960 [Syntrophobacterales bacterium]|jgi:hypothetical protein|nr:hypothetical protein [Syntrophobacterales bacterium]